ncbi:MAG: DUF3536 domain-containing protein [Elusimicrobia bacterium]|nr:DUF3536 domain-containing protein [Elusimicrobiota bacterium]
MNRYLCIHGHFYQPPRENPWIDEIEIQESARPFGNWNERISAECYHANAFARIFNNNGQIKDIVNNYSKISFNFGPTLLSWLEKYDRETYQAILRADEQSQKNFGGHGSAIAQVYNHIIMPLADDKDKLTQIVWGIKDFELRFKRKPEGIWLAETAVDTKTLELLAENDIKFTILAPSQCAATRKIGDKDWQDQSGAKVPPGKPYLCNLPSGKKIALFFYDGPISQGIAFGDTLKSGEKFAARLLSVFQPTDQPQLVHIATDGETYGHHQKFAEMALAYCLDYIEKNKLAKITVYGEYLELFPPTEEAKIFENTAWSCSHGVQRWNSDCGCNSGGNRGWNQQWRNPLRKALDFVRDSLRQTFELKGAEYFKDVWAARNAYIEVIEDREKAETFLKEYGTPKALQDESSALKLMEMQRNTLLMYTSCGWFFDEISGIETVQIMAYAKKAIEYNKALTGQDIEEEFVNKLALAPSNIKSFGNGANVYNALVKPLEVDMRKAAINYAISYLLDEMLFCDCIYSYNISNHKVDVTRQGKARLVTGYGLFTSRMTLDSKNISFAVLHTEGDDITAGSIYGRTDNLEQIKEAFIFGDIENCKALIKGSFVDVMTIKDLLKGKQTQILAQAVENSKKRIKNSYSKLFDQEKGIFNYLYRLNLPMPELFENLSAFAINQKIKNELHQDPVNPAKVAELLGFFDKMPDKLEKESFKRILTKKLKQLTEAFASDPFDLSKSSKIIELLSFAEMFNFPTDLAQAQNIVFAVCKKLPEHIKQNQLIKVLCAKLNLNLE